MFKYRILYDLNVYLSFLASYALIKGYYEEYITDNSSEHVDILYVISSKLL